MPHQDWDRILVGSGGHFTVWPDTVGILRDRVGNHPELANSKSTAYGPLDVYSSRVNLRPKHGESPAGV